MKDTIVVDLDGTLADLSHRLPLVKKEPPEWDRFYASVSGDEPKQWCVELIKSMAASGFNVLIVSARRRDTAADTIQWLKEKAGLGELLGRKLDVVLLREMGTAEEYTPDQILKKRWLDSFGKDRILFVVDDRQRVVDMWREEGLTCLQCDKWEEYKRPKSQVIIGGTGNIQAGGDIVINR